MKSGWAVLILIVLVISGRACAQKPPRQEPEQTHFSAEDESVKNPIAIPDDVLALLRQDKMVRSSLEYEGIPPEKLPLSWFSASAIHLSGPGEPDLIVAAEGPLMGANVENFWVFRHTDHGYDLVLNAPAHDLIVVRTVWNKLREIEVLGATAASVHTVRLRFDGRRYVLYRDKWEDIR